MLNKRWLTKTFCNCEQIQHNLQVTCCKFKMKLRVFRKTKSQNLERATQELIYTSYLNKFTSEIELRVEDNFASL